MLKQLAARGPLCRIATTTFPSRLITGVPRIFSPAGEFMAIYSLKAFMAVSSFGDLIFRIDERITPNELLSMSLSPHGTWWTFPHLARISLLARKAYHISLVNHGPNLFSLRSPFLVSSFSVHFFPPFD